MGKTLVNLKRTFNTYKKTKKQLKISNKFVSPRQNRIDLIDKVRFENEVVQHLIHVL